MKRIFLFVMAATMLVACSKNETPKRQGWLEETPLYGNVEKVTKSEYTAVEKFGDIDKKEQLNEYEYKFNEVGDVIEGISSDASSTLVWKEVYEYANGNKILWTKYGADGKLYNSIISDVKQTVKYDDNGKCIEVSAYSTFGSLVWKEKYKYDEDGNCIEIAKYNGSGSLDEKYVKKYDENGYCTENAKYDDDGDIEEKSVFKYDEDGNCESETLYDDDEDYKGKFKYKYDDKGNRTERIKYSSSDKIKERLEYKYDEQGNCIQIVCYETEMIGWFEKSEIAPKKIIEYKIEYRK